MKILLFKNLVTKDFNFDDFAFCDNNLSIAASKTDYDISIQYEENSSDEEDEDQ